MTLHCKRKTLRQREAKLKSQEALGKTSLEKAFRDDDRAANYIEVLSVSYDRHNARVSEYTRSDDDLYLFYTDRTPL